MPQNIPKKVMVYSQPENLNSQAYNFDLAQICLENAPIAIFRMDQDAIIVEVNQRACRNLGYVRDELLGLSLKHIDPTFSLEKWRARRKGLKPYESITFETNHKRKDGSIFPVEITINNYPNQGKIYSYAFVEDITLRKKDEEKLRASEELFRNIFEKSQLGIVLISPDSFFLMANQAFCEMVGYSFDELMLKLFFDLAHPDGREEMKQTIASLWGEEIPFYKTEKRFIHKNGQIVWVFIIVTTIKGKQGQPECLLTMVENITERKNTEAMVVKSTEQIRAMFESISDGITFTDLQGTITQVNGAVLKMHGYKNAQELIGKNALDLINESDHSRAMEYMKKTFLTGRSGTVEYKMTSQNGQCLDVELSSVMLTDNQGAPVGFVALTRDISDRKRIQENLAESEERYRQLVELAPDAFLIHQEGKIVFTNAAGLKLLGAVTADQLIGRHIIDFVPSNLSFLAKKRIDDTLTGLNIPVRYEQKILRLDGEIRNIELSGMRTSYHHKPAIQFMARDLTEQKIAEADLKASEFKFRALIEQMPEYIWQKDCNSQYITCNNHFAETLGLTPETILGHRDSEFFPIDMANKYDHDDQLVISTGKPIEIEEAWIYKGEKRWLLTNKVPLLDANSVCIGTIGTALDITERKRQENLLQALNDASTSMQKAQSEKEIFCAAAQELLKIGFYCVILKFDNSHQNLGIVYYSLDNETNKNKEKIVPETIEQFFMPFENIDAFRIPVLEKRTILAEDMSDTFCQLFPPELSAILTKTIYAPLMVENEVIGLLVVQSPDLQERDIPAVTALAHQLVASWQKSWSYEKAQQEISARRDAELQVRRLNDELEKRVEERTAELVTANQELEAFAYSISHDLRAPLRSINGHTHILLEDYMAVLGEDGRRSGEVITRETKRMGQLIDDLLAFSRLGRTELNISLVNMDEMVNSICRDMKLQEGYDRFEIHINPLPSIQADQSLIHQVWVNLISNAFKFSRNRPMPLIEIGSISQKESITYWIRDNGAGFDIQYIDQLFGVFRRLHTDKEYEGTGVGLAIVKRIVQRHTGKVWADAKINAGASFFFSLPV